MDIGKFKTSRARLTAWILIPPVLMAGLGLMSFALKLQSQWQLERTQVLAELLPRVVEARRTAEVLLQEFADSEAGAVKNEDELISFLQRAALQADFLVDSLKVERRGAPGNKQAAVLTANVRGTGTFRAVQAFMSDVSMRQNLLSESSLQVSQGGREDHAESCRAEITFELVLFDSGTAGGGA